jgi:Asp-tRNA(Asn)/Glu-tRNA(Gln) amidotransferase A subunit family amidase
MKNILAMSVREIAAAIRKKEVSSIEVVEAFLRRIHEINPKLNAVVELSEESARKKARRADSLLSQGIALEPLHGVPMTMKDSFDAEGDTPHQRHSRAKGLQTPERCHGTFTPAEERRHSSRKGEFPSPPM